MRDINEYRSVEAPAVNQMYIIIYSAAVIKVDTEVLSDYANQMYL